MVERSTEHDEEVETQIMLLDTPFGDGPHLREREQAAAWLLAHADRAYPRVLALLDEGRAGLGMIELSPRFGRAESIPPLARLLAGPERAAWIAGQALAKHPHDTAGEALRDALASADTDVVIAALDALATRGDPHDCATAASALSSEDGRVRYHALQAAGTLGCLERTKLESLEQTDASADVRDLATKMLESSQ